MTLPQLLLLAVAALAATLGLPMLTAPAIVRRAFGWGRTPQSVYILRIAGMMLTALGLILATFTTLFWWATG
ncbi:hypothetical protein PQ455_07950 [Sphingomonas naphthae]|uniref:Uncharacterized protein n=1 Tax=Sphingomonas naphthae TaxID=1813468 RepID=A0ABY7TPG6_9SPHN|nr:hypothetical protein [Sphingomonas naphthae]WCT75136.1 hypothetical protein PQ455_07950 [Sphingomonas naphthae]